MKKGLLLFIFSFLSFMANAQLALEGFEGTFPPTGWAVFDNGVTAATNVDWSTNATSYQGSLAAYMNRPGNIGQGNTSEDYLVTMAVNIPANGQLRFFARTFTSGNTGTIYQIKTAPSTATQNDYTAYTNLVVEYTEDQLTLDPNGVQNAFNVYTEKIVNFPVAMWNTQVYVAFVLKYNQVVPGLSGDRWLLDNVQIVQQCLPPTALGASPQATTATLNWTGTGTSYEIELIQGTGAPTGVATHTASATSLALSGLTPNTQYCYYVRELCGPGNNSTWAGPFCFTTTTLPPACGGNYVDAGGTTANYANNTDETVVICPVNSGDVVTVTFTSFQTEATWDGMYVFNGNSIAAPQISSANPAGNVPGGLAGSFWGNTIPGPFTSTSPDGCLTFRFRSDGFVNQAGWVANITCGPAPTCPNPYGLSASAVTSSTATLNWTSNSGATTFNVIAVPCGSPAPNASTTGYQSVSTNTNALITGLNADTCYDIYVRDECSASDFSAWIGVTNITTQPTPPACGGVFTDPGGAAGNYANGTDYTVTICPTTPGDVVTVTFTSFQVETNWDGLYVFNGNSTGAPQISSGNPAGNVPGGLAGPFWGTTLPGPFTSTAADGCLTFRFRSDGSVNQAGWVANVSCGLPPTCPNPNGLSVSTITSSTADLTWTSNSGATTFNVIALPCGSPPPTNTTTGYQIVATNTNATVTGLDPDTCYDLYARDECGPSDFSIWLAVTNVTTQIAPPTCGGTFTDLGGATGNYTGNTDYIVTICPTTPGEQVTVTFTDFDTETNWDGLYIYDSDTVGVNQIDSGNPAANVPGGVPGSFWGTTLPDPVTASTPSGCLTFRFRSDGSVNFSGWIANVTCAPPPTCPKPSLVTISAIGQTQATIGWTEMGTATQWQVLVLPASAPAPTAASTGWVTASTNPFVYNGLPSGSQLKVYVRSVCSDTDISLWSNGAIFATLIANDECDNAITVPVNSSSSCVQSVGGTVIGATASSQANGCGGTADDDVWFSFTATNTSHNINLNNVAGSTTDLFHAVYSGDCNNLTQLYCSDANNSTASGLTVGETYFIRVYTWTSTPNQTSTFDVCITTPPLSINNTQYTIPELVTDVLIGSTCAQVTNVTWNAGTGPNGANPLGIGYFEENYPSFTFQDGVILSTGDVTRASGPNTVTLSDTATGWGTDTQLFNYIQGLGIDPQLNSYNNASVLEFDFVPLTNQISFDFIFASEEYGTFQCTFSDAFAFFLTEINTSTTTNLAVLPSSTTPISVVTIRDNAYNGGCASVNPEYFNNFYQLPQGIDPQLAPINFNGDTVELTAQSAVVPNTPYHIKLVIADRNDTAFDSAVFLRAGSFNIGDIELGGDFLESEGTAICAGASQVIDCDLDPSLFTFAWTLNGQPLPGETGPSITATQEGVYELTATYINTTCGESDSVTVEYYDPVVANPSPNNLTACDADGIATFTLSNNDASVLGGLPSANFTVTYYSSLSGAQNETPADLLPNTYQNTTPFSQTIYAHVENAAGCSDVTQFNLVVQDLTPQFTLTPDTTICEGSSANVTVTPINYNNNDVTFSWTYNSNPLAFTTPSITVGLPGTYTVTVNNNGCTASASMVLSTNVCAINMYATAVWMDDCTTPGDGKFYNTTGSGVDLINPDGSSFTVDYGVHVQNSATLIMRGAEVKTQKSGSSNVCAARMNYRVFPTGNTPGTFTPWNLPFYSDCSGGVFINGGGPCTDGQQKWQCVSAPGCTAPLDLTTLTPGNYTIQVYYDIDGSYSTTSGCSDNLVLDNAGSYYTATFTIQAPTSITGTNPVTCNGNNGSITIANLIPNQSYELTYTDDGTAVGPVQITADANGNFTIGALNAGVYTNFSFGVNSCSEANTTTITLVDPGIPVVTVNNATICNGQATTVTATPAIPGNYTYTWTVPAGATNPGNVASFTTTIPGDYTVVITPTNTSCNLDFETPAATGIYPNMVNDTDVPCWETTAGDGVMEYWPSPNYENVTAYQGNQFVELNGNSPDTFFQNFEVIPGSTLAISFAHRGRWGDDTIRVEIGPQGGPYTNLGDFTDGNTAWGFHNVSYVVPTTAGVNYTVRFISIATFGNNPTVGNFLDAITISSTECSSLPATGVVSVSPDSTITLTSGSDNQTVCINNAIETIVYTTTDATDATVTGLPAGVNGAYDSASGTFTISGTPTESGVFNFTVTTVANCAVATANGTITVNPTVTLALSSGSDNQTLCINTPITQIDYVSGNGATDVTATGLPAGVNAVFTGGTLSITGTPTESGVFNYSVTTVGGCSSVTLNGTITVNPDVTLVLTNGSDNQTVCINTAVQNITYTATGATDVTVSGLPAGVTATYASGTLVISGTPSESGIFNYIVTTTGGCNSVTLNGTITVNPNVTMTLDSGNNNQTLCINTGITPIQYSTTNGVTNVTASGLPNGVSGTFASGVFTISGTPTVSGTFNYTVTTVGGCSSVTLNGTIVVNPLATPTFNFGTTLTLCPGAEAPSLPTVSTNGVSGTWNPDTISNTVSGTYLFTPNAGACSTTTTLSVTVESSFDFVLNGDCSGTHYVLQADPIDGGYNEDTATYSWEYNSLSVGSSETFDLTAYLASTTVNEELPITISLTVTRPDGCSKEHTITVENIYCDIPKGISPNGDGDNDFFDLTMMNVKQLNIFNRYGTKVYSKSNYTNEWTGLSDSGQELPDGTYYYVIEFANGQETKTGWVYINRQKR